MANVDDRVVSAFNDVWGTPRPGANVAASFASDASRDFERFFSLFPFAEVQEGEGFDLGCGGGRMAERMAPRVRLLHCIDPAPAAIARTNRRFSQGSNVQTHLASVDAMPMPDGSQNFGYSLGVLHHIPDPAAGLASCVRKLKPGAPFLLYLYYRLDNRPFWYRLTWMASDVARRFISRLPPKGRRLFSDAAAISLYWPLSRLARVVERVGGNPDAVPLGFYRKHKFDTLRADALDRFGTPREHRFTRKEMDQMMRDAGLTDIVFREEPPYWVALGRRGLII